MSTPPYYPLTKIMKENDLNLPEIRANGSPASAAFQLPPHNSHFRFWNNLCSLSPDVVPQQRPQPNSEL